MKALIYLLFPRDSDIKQEVYHLSFQYGYCAELMKSIGLNRHQIQCSSICFIQF